MAIKEKRRTRMEESAETLACLPSFKDAINDLLVMVEDADHEDLQMLLTEHLARAATFKDKQFADGYSFACQEMWRELRCGQTR